VLCLGLGLALAGLGVAVAVAASMRSMQGFQAVVNFPMMPMFFLSGALFPLQGLPAWLMVLTRLDPATYGIAPIRKVVLVGAGAPESAVNGLGLTLFGQQLAIPVEAGITLLFGITLVGLGVLSLHRLE